MGSPPSAAAAAADDDGRFVPSTALSQTTLSVRFRALAGATENRETECRVRPRLVPPVVEFTKQNEWLYAAAVSGGTAARTMFIEPPELTAQSRFVYLF